MEQHLATTNLLLGIMAAVSLLEAFLLIAAAVAGFMMYRRVMSAVKLLDGFEARQVAPLVARMHAVIDDVKDVTATVREETERVDQAIRTAFDRVGDTADRVRFTVRAKTGRIVGLVRGVRAAIEEVLTSRHPPPAGIGR
jgi:hypothetical protein